MLGILIVGHGEFPKGLYETCKLFYGHNIEQFTYLSLDTSNDDTFVAELQTLVEEVDEGDGTIILTDLLGGTPFTQSVFLDSDNKRVISGVNLILILELLSMRESQTVNIDELIDTARRSIKKTSNDMLLETDEF